MSGDLKIDIAIELVEALVAADLCLGRAEQPSEHVLEVGRLHHVILLERDDRVEPAARQVGAQVSACVVQRLVERAAVGVEPVGEHVDRDAVDGESDKDVPLVGVRAAIPSCSSGEQFRLFGGVGGAEAGAREEIPASCSSGISRPCQARLRSFTAASSSANL